MRQELLELFKTTEQGLTNEEATSRQKKYGFNKLPEAKIQPLYKTFLHQFLDPLIYILLFGAGISFFLKEFSDGFFILIILSINSVIGAIQEYSAQKSANSLKNIIKSKNIIIRDGSEIEIESIFLTIGDIVILKDGVKVPADLILLESENLEVNESMLTGESIAVKKDAEYVQKDNCLIQEKFNELFAGTIITKGFAKAIVSKIGLQTEMGKIADTITQESENETPLMIRMNNFSKMFTIIIGVSISIIILINVIKGHSASETFLMAVSLAVAAIPEGLPITITIALSIAMSKMAKKNVIVKNLSAVEALGSCTAIASDKTGTLTKNELTITKIIDINGNNIFSNFNKNINFTEENFDNLNFIEKNIICSVLSNEAGLNNGKFFGDAVDVAFLKYVINQGIDIEKIRNTFTIEKTLFYTSENKCSASFNTINNKNYAFVKGAPETIALMCRKDGDFSLIKKELEILSEEGMRILATAYGEITDENYNINSLKGLNFLSLVSMNDPLRPESFEAVKICQKAGIKVLMITGDSPKTAFTISKQLGFVQNLDEVKTGNEVKEAKNKGIEYLDALIEKTNVYSRMEPTQKLDIVNSLIRTNNFVAVTGDGVNDAPALNNANIGIAMGKSGSDIAKESADMILLDDNFFSITKAIEEGRIVYNNIRKVIFFAVSCGIPKVLIYILAIIFNLPMPFNASQLLWLNVMTEGIQNISLAFEREEGNEMEKKPRDPKEDIFNKKMIFRTTISIVAITIICFSTYFYNIKFLKLNQRLASSILLMLFIFIQNMQVLNSRSEDKSLFKHNFKKNKMVIFGILCAISVHIFASYIPFFQKILKIVKLDFVNILWLFCTALTVIIVSEIEKFFRRKFSVEL